MAIARTAIPVPVSPIGLSDTARTLPTDKDAPGFANVDMRLRYALNLTFEGRLIDTRSGVQLANKTWTVVGQVE